MEELMLVFGGLVIYFIFLLVFVILFIVMVIKFFGMTRNVKRMREIFERWEKQNNLT